MLRPVEIDGELFVELNGDLLPFHESNDGRFVFLDGVWRFLRDYAAHGGAADYFECDDFEVLCESGAGTGKTRSLLEKAYRTAVDYPGSRQFFARNTHKDLADTVLPEWEQFVLGPGHPAIHGDAKPANRRDYRFPNGSVIDLFGMANPDSRMSGQWHRGNFFETHEIKLESWEKMITRLRAIPVLHATTRQPIKYQCTGDTNPHRKSHWANKRCEEPFTVPEELAHLLPPPRPGQKRMTRIKYRHEDNPRWYDHARASWTPAGAHYIGVVLGGLTGPRRERLLYHRWVSEEGLVWPEYDVDIHVVDGEVECNVVNDQRQFWVRIDSWKDGDGKPYRERVARFIAGQDWGSTAAGTFGVLAVTESRLKVVCREVYFRNKSIDWWAEVVDRAQAAYGLDLDACDPSRKDLIEHMNLRMGSRMGRDGKAICRAANNRKQSRGTGDINGLDIVRLALRPPKSKRPDLVFLRDRFPEGVDTVSRDELRLPWSFTTEVEDYLWLKSEDGEPARDETDPTCEDHGCDWVRYACTAEFELARITIPEPKPVTYKPGQIGYTFPPPKERERRKREKRTPFYKPFSN